MNKSCKKYTIPPLDDKDMRRQIQLIEKATLDFSGPFDELEKAIGMLMLGRLVGWKVLSIIHTRRTLLKYEGILKIKVKEEFPDVGPLAEKSLGYLFVLKAGDFWNAVRGGISVENRREFVS